MRPKVSALLSNFILQYFLIEIRISSQFYYKNLLKKLETQAFVFELNTN